MFSSEDYQKYWRSGYNCQEESWQNVFFLYIYSEIESESENMFFQLPPDNCNQNASIFDSLQTNTRIFILTQSFGFGSTQPLLISCTSLRKIQVHPIIVCGIMQKFQSFSVILAEIIVVFVSSFLRKLQSFADILRHYYRNFRRFLSFSLIFG